MLEIKQLVVHCLYKLLEIIEYFELRDRDLNEDDDSKKIIQSNLVSGYKVLTDTGYVDIEEINQTQPYRVHRVWLENGLYLDCASNHILYTSEYKEVFVSELVIGDFIITKDGPVKVIDVIKMPYKLTMGDLSVDHPNQRYYTNDILSHNTISSSIFILHTILFSNDKNVMIVANKGDTAIEIIDKIKSIYTLLPFFLKPGAKIWNQKSLTFENGCRLKISARSKTPAIGFTIDLLYLDEFAHIPSNIIEPYYTAAFPVTAAVKNSKIIITSTPNGMNLFHKLLTNAERPDGDPLKNNYKALRVYWHQVPGRFVTYVRLNDHHMYNLGITRDEVFQQLYDAYSAVTKVEMEYLTDNMKYTINIFNNDLCSDEDVNGFMFVDSGGKERWLHEFAEVTSWKKEAIKDIGGEDAFNQEYDLRFINGSRSLLTESVIEKLIGGKRHYAHRMLDALEKRLKFSYAGMSWVDNDDVFNHANRLNVKGVMSIDIAEGLGQDYSIINIFKIDKKPDDVIEMNRAKYTKMSDFFNLTQIGLFRSNLVSVKQLAEVFYTLAFEYFNPDNFKVVLEMNMFGGELLAHLPHLFGGNNNYGSYIFFRYKHRADAEEEKIGLKIGENKNIIVKKYQDAMNGRDFVISNEDNVREITTFVKHVTASGNIRYAGDSGNDDSVMTVVNASTVFEKSVYYEMVDDYAKTILDNVTYNKYNEYLKNSVEHVESADYTALLNVNRRRKLQNVSYQPKIDWSKKSG